MREVRSKRIGAIIAPPITTVSAFFRNFSKKGALVANLLPPRIKRKGRGGLKARERIFTSFRNRDPAKDGRYSGMPTIEVCLRCETLNASLM